MSFPHQLAVIIPVDIVDAANRIALAMDEWGNTPPFNRVFNSDGDTYFLSWAGENFTDWVKATRGSASKLRDDVNAKIASRGLDIEPLTVEEAEQFMDGADIVVNAEVGAVRNKLRVPGEA